MPKTRSQKEQAVAELTEKFGRAKSITFFDFTGAKTPKINALKSDLRKIGADFIVAKKTLVDLALKNVERNVNLKSIKGPIGAIISFEDEIEPIKAAAKFLKTNKDLPAKFQGGFVDVFYSAEDIKKLAAIPSRLELYGQLIGNIARPIQGLVYVLNANIAGLARVLSAIKK